MIPFNEMPTLGQSIAVESRLMGARVGRSGEWEVTANVCDVSLGRDEF